MEQHVFMKYKNKLIEGSSERVNITFKDFKINIVYCFNFSKVFKYTFYLH
jgi:hypothetical protein